MKSRGSTEHRFSLIIEGEALPMMEIGDLLGLEPTRVIHKGDVINRLPEIVAEADEWMHTVTLDAPEGVDENLNHLLSCLASRQEQVNEITVKWKVTLRLYVQSDYAQIAYRFMPETLKKLVAVGLPLDVSSLSWGEVDI